MNAQWDIPLHVDTSLAAFVRGVLPTAVQTTDSSSAGSNNRSDGGSQTSAERRRHSGDSRHPTSNPPVSIRYCYLLLQLFYGSLDYVRDNPGEPVPEKHSPITTVVVINHPLSVSSIYYDPWHSHCLIYMPCSLFAHTIATCFDIISRICHVILSLNPLLGTHFYTTKV